MKTIKIKQSLIITLAFFGLTNVLFAQNEDDVLRYSRLPFGGTARSMGMGGAFGALGSDFSTLSNNPAGLGLYRKSEFTLSPSIYTGNTKASYMGETNSDNKYSFNFANVGLVFASSHDSKNNDWKGFNFGFGYNRLANFGNRMVIKGNNSANSLLDQYLGEANGKDYSSFDKFGADLAWQTYLINPVDSVNKIYSSEMPSSVNKVQEKTVETKGGIGETVLSFAGNYNNKLFIGGTVGFDNLRYWQNSSYMEYPVTDTIHLKGFTKTDALHTYGTGVNFKFGMIFMPVEFVRIGASVHTPTFYRLTDDFSSTMEAQYNGSATQSLGTNGNTDGPKGSFNYSLNTPYRATGSLAFIIKQFGLISADYEFVDYREANLHASSYSFAEANQAVRDKYRATSNIRVGTEWRLAPFAIRLGYAMYGSPFKNNSTMSAQTFITGGLGYRDEKFFFDIAYIYAVNKESYYLYTSNPTPSQNTINTGNIVVTVGTKF